ncbi:hypothetical protein ACFWIB_24715 [Streptomyces sp. NPDC127051]|uniref:hypothetical protein n=1 Tax=Streptomyces sp. NPDC127051 TaxID=3347119 RepID=UPI00365324BE
MTAYIWESLQGHPCLGESEAAGQLRAVKCATGQVKPAAGSGLAALFGPGMLSGRARVVLTVEPGQKVEAVEYRKQRMDWKYVRTLTASGRDVYYVMLPDFPDDWLDVTLRVSGQQKADRIWLGW